MADMIPTAPEASNAIETDWHKYKTNGRDRAGRIIKEIYAVEDKYVIYFVDHAYSEPPTNLVGLELYYELEDGLVKVEDLAKADAELAGINRLLDAKQEKGNREYNFNFSILGLAAGALEMVFSHETTEALEILQGVHDKLLAKEDGQRRLMYQLGALSVASVIWFAYLYLLFKGWTLPFKWEAWVLAVALAGTGGLFSVCLNIESLAVNVNQGKWFLFCAGGTRAVIAFLAGAGLLLAMRAKIFGGIAYEKNPVVCDPLTGAEMFFCFLAGFSERFVPNILSKTAADKAADATRKQKEGKEKAKAAAAKKQGDATS